MRTVYASFVITLGILTGLFDLGLLLKNVVVHGRNLWWIHHFYAVSVFTIRQALLIVLIKDGLTTKFESSTLITEVLAISLTVLVSCLLATSSTLLNFQLFVEVAIFVITVMVMVYSKVYNKQQNVINPAQQVAVLQGGNVVLLNLSKNPDKAGDRLNMHVIDV